MATAITAAELVSYLRDPSATETDVALIVTLANGLVSDELTTYADDWPTWVRILALDIAEAGWTKFSEESIDDWSAKRKAALSAMSLSSAEQMKLAQLDGRVAQATAYTVPMSSPWDAV